MFFSCSRIDYDYIKILENVVSTFMIQHHYKDTAAIILKGAWLETLGFEPGTPINVECGGGRLVITRADEVI